MSDLQWFGIGEAAVFLAAAAVFLALVIAMSIDARRERKRRRG